MCGQDHYLDTLPMMFLQRTCFTMAEIIVNGEQCSKFAKSRFVEATMASRLDARSNVQ